VSNLIEEDKILVAACSRFGNPVPVSDDAFGDWYLYYRSFGFESLVSAIVRESSFEEALYVAYDTIDPIDEEDVPEAYGLSILEYGPDKEWWSKRDTNEWDVIDDEKRDRNTFKSLEAAKMFVKDRMMDGRGLTEDHRYQDNATGTGIVYIGYGDYLEPMTKERLQEEGIVLIWETED